MLSKLEDLEDEETKKKKHMSKLMDSFVEGEEIVNEEEGMSNMGDDDMSDMGDDDMNEDDSDSMGDDEM